MNTYLSHQTRIDIAAIGMDAEECAGAAIDAGILAEIDQIEVIYDGGREEVVEQTEIELEEVGTTYIMLVGKFGAKCAADTDSLRLGEGNCCKAEQSNDNCDKLFHNNLFCSYQW